MNAEELKEAIIRVLESNLEYYSTGLESFEKLERGDKESVITGIEGLVDEYANQSKWTSVTDVLPKAKKKVLVKINGTDTLYIGHFLFINGFGNVVFKVEGYVNQCIDVTHYQPLPTFNEK